jgi:hypothetical protein
VEHPARGTPAFTVSIASFLWMVSSTNADFATKRLISSSITTLIGVSPIGLHLSRNSLGHYTDRAHGVLDDLA